MLTKALKAKKARLEGEKGFTLIELLAVIVILGIIAVIAIPLIGNIIDNSKKNGDIATAHQVYAAARLYITGEKGGDFIANPTVTISDMQSKGYLDKPLSIPSSKVEITSGTVTFSNGQLESVTIVPAPKGADKDGKYTAKQVLSSDADKK